MGRQLHAVTEAELAHGGDVVLEGSLLEDDDGKQQVTAEQVPPLLPNRA